MSPKEYPAKKLAIAALGEVVAFGIGAATPYAVYSMFSALHEFMDMIFWSEGTLYYLLLFVIPGLILGLALAFGFRAAYLRPGKPGRSEAPTPVHVWKRLFQRMPALRVFATVILVGYLITWAFGVPSVASDIFRNDQKRALQAAEYYEQPYQSVSSVVSFAVPVLPGVVVAYHYHLGGKLHGWGGWKVYVWYVTGERQLFEVVRWVT